MPDDNITIVTDAAFTDLESRLQFMQASDDFPALSTTIGEINNVVSSETSSIQHLTNIILEDFSLTKNLLKVVNTVSYGQFGGQINTISKAVVILGFDVVRDIATTLVLLDFLQNKSQGEQLKDQVVSAYFVGLISRQLTINFNASNYEEAMICGIFHNLGQLLAHYYFFDEAEEINQLMADGMSETEASRTVLGVSYDKLGLEVAKRWNLPDRLTHAMQNFPNDKVPEIAHDSDRLRVTVNLANELTAIAANTQIEEKHKTIQHLVNKYKKAVQVDASMMQKALDQALNEMAARANILKLVSKKTQWLKRIADYTNETLSTKKQQKHIEANKQALADLTEKTSINPEAEAASADEPVDGESTLQAGIQDVINTLVGEYNVNEVIQMILETMYRGLQCHRVLLFIRDGKTKMMQARSGYGHDIDEILPKFKFPLDYSPDVFHLPVDKGVDIVIVDTNADKIASKIPPWYKKVSSAKSFLLLPVMINKKAVGCFYADMQSTHGFDETSKSLSLVRTLRNQAVLAIKQN
jgi:eukaryotic-like serine/threonine-protein kinase